MGLHPRACGTGGRVKVCGVTGGRNRFDGAVCEWLARHKPDLVIVGDATGVDQSARNWCAANGTAYVIARANWQRWSRAAGPKRNQTIVDTLRAFEQEISGDAPLSYRNEVVLGAFPGGTGTADCIRRARKAHLTVQVVYEADE